MYIATVFLCISVAISFVLYFVFSKQKYQTETLEENCFSVCEYYDRIEKQSLKILEEYKPVDQTIILWWGFDGLRLNENGSIEWIRRKNPEPVNQGIFFHPMQSLAQYAYPVYSGFDSTQAVQSRIDDLKMQNALLQVQAAQSKMMDDVMQCCCSVRDIRGNIRTYF